MRLPAGRRVSGALSLFLLLLMAAWPAWSQSSRTALNDYSRDLWTSRNGLPHNTLRDIAQTPDGHLWFATWEGLARYNGLDFTVFDRNSRPPVPDNGIGTLYVDRERALWVGDSRGNVTRFDQKGRWQQWRPPHGDAPAVMIEAMHKDSRDRLWLLYEGTGLGRLDPDGRFHHFLPPAALRDAVNFTHMAVDGRDRVWIGTFDGLLYLDVDGVIKRAPAAFDLPPGLAWPYLAPDHSLWVVAADHLYRMEGEHLVLKHRLPGVGQLTEMLLDRHGEVWVGTENNGLWRLGEKGAEHLRSTGALLDSRVISLLEDQEGSIWVGLNGGLLRLREALFNSYTHSDGLSGDFIRTLTEDANGALWIGSSSGLDRMLPDGRIEPVALRPGERQPSILALATGNRDDVWIGTRGEGVFHIDDRGRVQRYRPGEEVPRGNYRAIALAPDGRVWLGSAHGVLQLENGRAVPVVLPGMPRTVVLALSWLEDTLWIGTTEGVWRMQGGRAQKIDIAKLGDARAVYGFRQIDDAVWITSDRGLYRYTGNGLAHVGLQHGLPVDTVFELVPDALGNVWLSSNRGIWRTDAQQLQAVADGTRPRLEGVMYREIDGVASAQANGSSGPAAVRRRDGSIWVATAGGVTTVQPAALQRFQSRPPPTAVIENVRLDGEPLNWRSGEAKMIPGGLRVAVNYVGLSYLMSDRIRYRTRLEGLERDWVERGNQRGVEYVGLPPGNYALHVSAAHPDGRWSEGAALWQFTVQPLWWQRLDVHFAALLLVLLALYALFRYVIHRYEANNARLARLVEERTHDLKLQADHLLAANEEKSTLAERLREQAEAFERQAREDALTGLANRRAFDQTLAREMTRSSRNGQPLSLVVLDIDHFKNVNDTWSHGVGDEVLRKVGRLLRSGCRESDLAARLGGEEFALILSDTPLAEALRISERLRELFHAQPDWADIAGLHLTFSAGVVQLGAADQAPEQLYARADLALYRAKSEGRDRICEG
ncbi:histidine kinase [Stenotrophomonas pictorum JCM 9942]|uniref:diguanylate cyclase n=1 Tax=Stenotrophomonas pictorum JCM 9942 TaxID=1236960 RepID=A0A0R0AQG4_9GAMM|nr:histidine kinase [Stenotrophomonas pictorum JCM 9942]